MSSPNMGTTLLQIKNPSIDLSGAVLAFAGSAKLCSYYRMFGVSGMGVAEERVLAAVSRLREQGVAERCGFEIAREVLGDR